MWRFGSFELLVKIGLHVLSHVMDIFLYLIERRTDVLNLVLPTRFELFGRLFKLPNPFTQGFPEFRQLLRSEDQKRNDKNHQHFRKTELTHESSCSRRLF